MIACVPCRYKDPISLAKYRAAFSASCWLQSHAEMDDPLPTGVHPDSNAGKYRGAPEPVGGFLNVVRFFEAAGSPARERWHVFLRNKGAAVRLMPVEGKNVFWGLHEDRFVFERVETTTAEGTWWERVVLVLGAQTAFGSKELRRNFVAGHDVFVEAVNVMDQTVQIEIDLYIPSKPEDIGADGNVYLRADDPRRGLDWFGVGDGSRAERAVGWLHATEHVPGRATSSAR